MRAARRYLLLGPIVVVFLLGMAPGSCNFLGEPDETGPFPVGRTSFEVVDPDRGDRTLPVDVWYPAVDDGSPASVYDLLVAAIVSPLALESPPVAPGPHPLLVFSHGSGGIRFQSYFLTEQLASHGFVVASADHVGNSASDIFLPGPPPPFETKDRPLDVSLLITRMLEKSADPDDPFFGSLDGVRIGVLGHSFGAFTALTMASGFQDVPPDPRVQAIAPIAPATGGLSDEVLAAVDIPTLILGGSLDDVTPVDPNSIRAFEQTSGIPRFRVDVDKAGHNSFTNICDFADALIGAGLPPELLEFLLGSIDQGCAPELIPIGEAHRVTNFYTVAFFQRQVAGRPGYNRYLTPGRVEKEDLPVQFFQVRGAGPP